MLILAFASEKAKIRLPWHSSKHCWLVLAGQVCLGKNSGRNRSLCFLCCWPAISRTATSGNGLRRGSTKMIARFACLDQFRMSRTSNSGREHKFVIKKAQLCAPVLRSSVVRRMKQPEPHGTMRCAAAARCRKSPAPLLESASK